MANNIVMIISKTLSGARSYLGEQFPPAQAVALGVACLVSYAAYGRLAGDISFNALAVVAAITVPVLFLQLRLLDDVITWYETHDVEDIAGASLPGLIVGLGGTTAVILVLNANHVWMFGLAIGTTVLMLVSTFVTTQERRLPTLVALGLGRVPLFEAAPAVMLAYVYAAWHIATNRSLSFGEVVVVVSFFWSSFNFWKLSRHLGDRPLERIYRLTWPVVRLLCVVLLAISLALSIALYFYADLSLAFLVYCVMVIAVFAVFSRPRGRLDEVRPWWVALPFPTAMIAGLLVQLLMLA
jgi:hypothetical protein